MKKFGVLIGIAFLVLLAGCDYFQKSSKEVVVAECYGKYLYASDLQGIVPEGVGTMDSLQRVSTFIDSWIKRQVLIHQAENNLNKEALDLDKQMEEYRSSLIIYAYESQLIYHGVQLLVDELALVGVDDQGIAVFLHLLVEVERFLVDVVLGLMDQHLPLDPRVDEGADTLETVHGADTLGHDALEVRLIEVLAVVSSRLWPVAR